MDDDDLAPRLYVEETETETGTEKPERREVFTPEQRRRAREIMSRRWTLAKSLKWIAIIETLAAGGVLLWDRDTGKIFADFLSWPLAIQWGAVATLLGVDSWMKIKKPI